MKEANPGLGLGAQQKIISAEWRALTDEQKAPYVELTEKDKLRYQAELAAAKEAGINFSNGSGGGTGEDQDAAPNELVLPLARVKKIMKLDTDVKNMSREATLLVTKATELFVGHISQLTFQHAEGQRRRTVKSEDLDAAVHNFDELEWLQLDFQKAPWLAPKPEVRRRAAPATAGADITAFMGQAQVAQEPANEAEPVDDPEGGESAPMEVDSGAVADTGEDGVLADAEAEAEVEAEAEAEVDAGAEVESSAQAEAEAH